jgi:hypothetical protein
VFKPLLIVIVAASIVPSPVLAAYVNDYAGWKEMTLEQRTGYAAALVDSLTLVSDDDTKVRQQWSSALGKCLTEQQLSSAAVADKIEAYYEAHPDEQDHLPLSVLLDAFLIKDDRTC